MKHFEKSQRDWRDTAFLIAAAICVAFVVMAIVLSVGNRPVEIAEVDGNSTKTVEEKLADCQDDLKSQHLKICRLNTEQLALDLVYIDYYKSTRYALYLMKIGSEDVKKSEDEKTFEQNAIEYYKGSSERFDGYSEDDFEKLCEALDGDQYKRMMAMALVGGFIGYDEGQLAVPTNNSKIRELLKYSWYDPDPRNPDNPNPDKNEKTE